jgi:TRAP-type C4-dicarboxylate transport system substrate-binding protein
MILTAKTRSSLPGWACALLAAVPLAGPVGLISSSAVADEIKLTIASGQPDALPEIIQIRDYFIPELKRRVEERTDHTININASFGTVISSREVLSAVEDGIVDIGVISCFCATESELYPLTVPYRFPFGSADPAILNPSFRRIVNEVPEVQALFKKHNQMLLSLSSHAGYLIFTKEKFSDLSELSGKTFAAAGGNIDWIPEALGVGRAQAFADEMYTGLDTGLFDGLIIHPEGAAAFKYNEVAKYAYDVGFSGIVFGGPSINLDKYDSLPEDVRQIIHEVAGDMEARYPDVRKKMIAESIATLKEKGVEFISLDDQMKKEWADAMHDLPVQTLEKAKSLGFDWAPKVWQTWVTAQSDLGHHWPRDDWSFNAAN